MIKYSLKLLRRNLLTNIFIALQIAVTLLMIILSVSSVMSKIEYYLPLRKVLSSEGMCLFSSGSYIDDLSHYYSCNDIINISDNIEEIYSTETTDFLMIPNTENEDEAHPGFVVYNKNMYDLYKPQMQEGKWLSDIKGDKNYISAVVSYSSKYNVGDTIEVYDYIDEIYYPLKIVGKTAQKAKFITNSSINEFAKDFRDLYGNIEGNMIFIRHDDIELTPISVSPQGIIFIKYKDGLSDEEADAIKGELFKMGGFLNLSDELNKKSIEYLSEDIMLILPICICVFIISLICTVASSAIAAKSHMKTFLITYICGARWKSNSLIILINSVITSAAGVFTAAVGYAILSATDIAAYFCIEFTKYEFLFCLPVLLLNIILPIILPLWMISKQTPKELITEE